MEEIKKYELTEETKEWQGHTLHRIRALKDFEVSCDEVKAGDIGGWVEGENNLSQYDNCWIFGDAWVYGNAKVSGNAKVCNETLVQGERR